MTEWTMDMVEEMNLKSHSQEDVLQALQAGQVVFEVDTSSSGNDDVVIMEDHETEDDVKALFCWHFDLDTFPADWSIRRLG